MKKELEKLLKQETGISFIKAFHIKGQIRQLNGILLTAGQGVDLNQIHAQITAGEAVLDNEINNIKLFRDLLVQVEKEVTIDNLIEYIKGDKK